MNIFKMLRVAWVLTWPYVFTPWRSPLLRWRIEVYGLRDKEGRLLHAEMITPRRFFGFLICRHSAVLRFLRWAARI